MGAFDIVSLAIGLATGFSSIVITIMLGLRSLSEARIAEVQLGNYLRELHGQMLSRFDRVDTAGSEILRRLPGS